MISLERDAVIGGRYSLRRPLGEGGMGWVWEAQHLFTNKRCALKFLKRSNDDDRRRFEREVRAAAAVRHPNVIDVHDFVELPDGTLVMVMDMLDGEALGAVLRREKCIALPQLAALLVPVASALEAAHALGIVHRDLKPDNIFLSKTEGSAIVVKVLDFGAAKLTATEGAGAPTGTDALTNTGSILGTPYYMSPEQVFAEKDLDGRADIWSLGVVIYECLTGSRPTEADHVGRVMKRIVTGNFEPIANRCEGLPDDVASLVTRMLSVDRHARPRDVTEVREILTRHAAERIVPFSAPEAEPVDPGAATEPASGGSSSKRRAAEPQTGAVEKAPGRADTHRSALSISVAGPKLARRSGMIAVAATVALLGGVLAVRGFTSSERREPPLGVSAGTAPASTEAPKSDGATVAATAASAVLVEASAPEVVTATATPTASAASIRPLALAATPTRRPVSPSAVSPSASTSSSSAKSPVWTER